MYLMVIIGILSHYASDDLLALSPGSTQFFNVHEKNGGAWYAKSHEKRHSYMYKYITL